MTARWNIFWTKYIFCMVIWNVKGDETLKTGHTTYLNPSRRNISVIA